MVGILLSYWGGLFSGAMLVSGRVILDASDFAGCFFCLIFHANEVKKQHPDDVLSFFLNMLCQTLKPDMFKSLLGGGFKHFLFSPLFGEMIQFY